MQKCTGKLDISRMIPSNNQRKHIISLVLHDDISGVVVIEIQLTPEMLSMALTGHAHVPCMFEMYDVDKVGKQRETKTETIQVKTNDVRENAVFEELRELAKPYEVDGWIFNMSSMTKLVRVADNTYRVHFVRYVDR